MSSRDFVDEEILRQPRYWTPAYCRSFFAEWDDRTFDDPQRARRLAEMGQALVERVERQAGEAQPALRALSLAVLGSARRAAGDLAAAREHYEAARALYEDLEEPLAEADLYRRLVFLYRDLERWEEAFDFANRAAKLFLAAGDDHRYGLVLMVRASLYTLRDDFNPGVLLLSKALAKLDYPRSPQAFYSAVHNFALALTQTADPSPDLLETALAWLAEARRVGPRRGLGKKRYGYRKRTVPDAKLRHLLGLLLRRIGRPVKATRFLEQAYEDLEALELPHDVVAVALDLGELYAAAERWDDLERLARQSLELLGNCPAATPLAKTLRQWQSALEAGDPAAQAAADCRAKLVQGLAAAKSDLPRDEESLRQRLKQAIRQALRDSRNLDELTERLREEGVAVHQRQASGERPAGISFEIAGLRFSGHQLGRPFRWSRLRERLAIRGDAVP